MGSYKTIPVKDHSSIREQAVATAAAISPGHLLEVNSSGNVLVHNSAGQNCEKMVALEDAMQGKEVSDAYAVSTLIQYGMFRPGDQVLMRLANGQNVGIGDYLESAGDGTLQAHTPAQVTEDSTSTLLSVNVYVNAIVGVAMEAIDMSGSSAVDPDGLILVRIT